MRLLRLLLVLLFFVFLLTSVAAIAQTNSVLVCHGAAKRSDGAVKLLPDNALRGHREHGDCRLASPALEGAACERSDADGDGYCGEACETTGSCNSNVCG